MDIDLSQTVERAIAGGAVKFILDGLNCELIRHNKANNKSMFVNTITFSVNKK